MKDGKGDLVSAEMAGRQYIGWVSGDTAMQVSVSDINWKRLGRFSLKKTQLIQRSTGLLVFGALTPINQPFIPLTAKPSAIAGVPQGA